MGKENKDIDSGLFNAAWGYFFLHFDFNLNNISIFPRFVGWLLLLSACTKLSGQHMDLVLLRPLVILLVVWHGLDWLLSWGGGDLVGYILFMDLLIATAGLYFHFQFLTDMAALAERYHPEDTGLNGQLRRLRTVYVVVITLLSLPRDLLAALPEHWVEWVVMGMVLAALIVAFLIMAALFRLRQCFREEETEQTVV